MGLCFGGRGRKGGREEVLEGGVKIGVGGEGWRKGAKTFKRRTAVVSKSCANRRMCE
jgi:hypothetical protein